MKCPKCGYEIPEGQLLCEKCGAEINIVPDFEPEIENSIKESLSTIIDDILPKSKRDNKRENIKASVSETNKNNTFKDDEFDEENIADGLLSALSRNKGKKGLIIAIYAVVVLFVVLILLGIFVYTKYSSSYQLNSAQKDFDNNKYEDALEHIENVIRLRPNDYSLIAKEADIYYAMGDSEKAKTLLSDAIYNKKLDFDEKMSLYNSLVNIYVSENNFEQINDMFIESNDPKIMDEFSDFISLPPTYSVPTGNYSEVKNLEILNTYDLGEIRYTLDGSVPTEDTGLIYTKPISLRPGEYEINSVYINEYGIVSDCAKSFYLIDLKEPDKPIVSPESGTYNEPIFLNIEYDEENSEVYYTVDGKNPDPEKEYTLKYDGKLTVPVGHFNYCFVTVGSNGLLSEIVKRSYHIDMKTKYTVTVAKQALINTLLDQKYIIDNKCTAPGGTGTFDFIYIDVVEINNVYFYRFKEHLDAGINSGDTGTYYGVEVNTGVSYRISDDGFGNMGLLPIG